MTKISRLGKYLGIRFLVALALLYFLSKFPFKELFIIYQNY